MQIVVARATQLMWALVKPVTVNIRDGQNLTAITEASRICHVAVTDFQ